MELEGKVNKLGSLGNDLNFNNSFLWFCICTLCPKERIISLNRFTEQPVSWENPCPMEEGAEEYSGALTWANILGSA